VECGGRYIILRASWTYSERRTNFPRTILRLAREKEELRIVADQIGTPTSARRYAEATAQLLGLSESIDCTGIYHLSASGGVSRYHWAEMALDGARERCGGHRWAKLVPIATVDYESPTERPLNSVMDTSKVERAFGVRMADWRGEFKTFLRNLPMSAYTAEPVVGR
jgi:dTDP-4-dehydrorhamnose reductase